MFKKAGFGAALLSSTMLLAACSASDPSESPSASADTAIDASGVELTIWVDDNREPAVSAAAAQFEEETGATVTLVVKNFADIRNEFIAQVPTGEGPDITVGAHDWTGALVTAGVIDTIDLGDKASEFEQVALDAFAYDGQLYGLPYALETIALIQNVDLVGEEAPATFDEMIEMGMAAGTERPFVINVSQ